MRWLFALIGLLAAPAGALELTACNLPGLDRPAKCGELRRPENPDKPGGRQIAVKVAVVPAASGKPLPDPIVVLMGGPGEPAIADAGFFAQRFAPLLADRDLLLVDQRGTGGSAALECPFAPGGDVVPLLKDIFPPKAVAACAAALKRDHDLTQYGFDRFADDLNAVREGLGYGPLNLFAGSYGTRAAQVFVRRHPKAARTLFMGSSVPIDVPTPPVMAEAAQMEMARLLDRCEADIACTAAYPNLRAEFRTVIGRLDRGEVRVSVPGVAATQVLHRGPVAAFLRARLYRPATAATIPSLIHRAHGGDWRAITDGVLAAARTPLSFGLFFAITCREDIAFTKPLPPRRPRTSDAESGMGFLGDYRLRQQQAACRHFPTTPLPAGYRTPVASAVPTLFSVGDSDGGAPMWFTDRVAGRFSNAVILTTAGQGHTEWSPCLADAYVALVRSGKVSGKRAQGCSAVPLPAFR